MAELTKILSLDKLERHKKAIKRIEKRTSTNRLFSELFYILGLQFFHIHETEPSLYIDMLNILMYRYFELLKRMKQAKDEGQNPQNMLKYSEDVYEQVMNKIQRRIPSKRCTFINIETPLEKITHKYTMMIHFSRYADPRFTIMAMNWLSDNVDTIVKAIQIVWINYRKVYQAIEWNKPEAKLQPKMDKCKIFLQWSFVTVVKICIFTATS